MGVSYLLDTHVLIWLLDGEPRPSDSTLDRIRQSDADIVVSAVSALELATKVRLGKFDAARDLVDHWTERIRQLGAIEIDVTSRHAIVAGRLDWAHRDPFDRLLVGQAICDNLTLVTADRVVLAAPGVRLLRW